MKTFIQHIKNEAVSTNDKSLKEQLQEIFSILFALFWVYNTNHWQAKGENYYSKHLLFQKLYSELTTQYDDLAEKMVSYFGEDAIDKIDMLASSSKWVQKWNKEKDIITMSLNAEQDLQIKLKIAYDKLKKENKLSLGLDDFIMSLANEHEKNIYLLGQIKK